MNVEDWHEAAQSVAKAGVCGNGSDGIVSQAYDNRKNEVQLRAVIDDNEKALGDWGIQIGLGGLVAGFASVGAGKATAFSIFCVADSINERRKKAEAHTRYAQLMQAGVSTPEAASYPVERHAQQGYANYPGTPKAPSNT